ncbi:uncharacterized protein BP5553_07513 [Venustampulla echinocandica]|uniref:F-box domain-containing protein n=1 Tax=Venustampulla echinocandica TaxID=2656787 RepID=A0A370TGR4_9HELO|nr:uncharacterized protein BP5553_07513 [Venustampulla echinocandica]RDL34385.1 hypothetical protein BP5553_07513 [Venustampulla echinocandica]
MKSFSTWVKILSSFKRGTPTLSGVPPEIVEHIASFLSSSDLRSLSVVSKDFSRRSIRSLQAIAANPLLAGNVFKLRVEGGSTTFGDGYEWVRSAVGSRYHLLRPYPGVDILAGLLSTKLTSCRSYEVNNIVKGAIPKARFGDIFKKKPKRNLVGGLDGITLLIALTLDTANPPRALSIDFGAEDPYRQNSPGVTYPNRLLSPKEWMSEVVYIPDFASTMRNNLEALHLTNSDSYPSTFTWAFVGGAATKLRELHLDFAGNYSSYESLQNLALLPLPVAPELQSLTFSKVPAWNSIIRLFSHRFSSSLRTLKIESCGMQLGLSWVNLFNELASYFPHLEHFSASTLREELSRSEYEMENCYHLRQPVRAIIFDRLVVDPTIPDTDGDKFTVGVPDGCSLISYVEYQGEHMDLALKHLATYTDSVYKGYEEQSGRWESAIYELLVGVYPQI